MRSISMAYPTIDLAATGAHIRQLQLEQGYSVQDLQAYLGLEHPQAIYPTGSTDVICPAWITCMP